MGEAEGMKPYYQDNHIEFYAKDCRSMSELADNSVQCVVTSPPYWGLRKYSGEQELIWGDNHCEHQWGERLPQHHPGQVQDNKAVTSLNAEGQTQGAGSLCSLCGAWKGAYGLEPTPEMYVQHTIEILREIRRVLRKDGVVFWNIGDSYNGSWGNSGSRAGGQRAQEAKKFSRDAWDNHTERPASSYPQKGLKPKDLCLIPFRIAIACQEAGWWVRSVIIWSKPNPMPESVTDRPTESHEYILMLTKSARYYWDADAVREVATYPDRWGQHNKIYDEAQKESLDKSYAGRNIRTVWEFPTQPYPEAHFAVFPEKLPETCIKAATPEVGCCSKCGAPWERIIEKGELVPDEPQYKPRGSNKPEWNVKTAMTPAGSKQGHPNFHYENKTTGWHSTCKCNSIKPPMPSIVLDPFAGAGTTLWVAKKLGRKAVGYEISEEYCELALERNRQQVLELKI